MHRGEKKTDIRDEKKTQRKQLRKENTKNK